MPSQQRMQRRMERTEDLRSVVGTMKALAAVSIRQYERAADSLDRYYRTVELGLQVLLRRVPAWPGMAGPESGARVAVVLGSDQGMCGRFNEQVVERAEQRLSASGKRTEWRVIAMGERVASLLRSGGRAPRAVLAVPGSLAGVLSLVQEILAALGETRAIAEVLLLHNRHVQGAAVEPAEVRLLPLDDAWLANLRARPWPTRQLPAPAGDPQQLFVTLVREYIFVSIYRAVAHSLAGENASRLASMQAAESNIEERLAELTTAYHQFRQGAITEELLDILSGFEVLSSE